MSIQVELRKIMVLFLLDLPVDPPPLIITLLLYFLVNGVNLLNIYI